VHVKDIIPLEIHHQLEEMHVILQKYVNIECLWQQQERFW
jgi:hypothetical protein